MALSLTPTHLPKPAHGSKYTSSEVKEAFRQKLEQITIKPQCNECKGCGRSYIQVTKLRNWLKEKSLKRPDTTWADLCLEAAYQGYNAGSLSLGDINAPDRECLLVFSILYDIGAPSLIHNFQRWGLTDTKLPITLLALENQLKEGSVDNAARLAKDFDGRQWTFCPTRFDRSSSFDCKKPTILPICKRGILSNKGGTALLWQIAVQEEFVGANLRQISAKSKFTDPDFGICYQFALKTFRDGHADHFKEEREAFWALREHDGMIRYLGDFSHPNDPSCHPKQENGSKRIGERERMAGDETMISTTSASGEHLGRMTTNILVEWGEYDLEDFFAARQPPVLASEVRVFWKELFEVAEALRRVHNFKKKNGQEFDGWYADIKPDNIIRVQSSFKLSDPGFAQFKPKKPNNNAWISGGTSTYGAPEWERSRKTGDPVPQAIDIWSLGCVFSIAASWVALGYKGVLVYEGLRETAVTASLDTGQPHDLHNQQGNQERPHGDFFHDGWNVLEAIQHWHKAVRQYIRRTDHVTEQVLDLVTDSMLQGQPSRRIRATDLCTRLISILDSCPEKPEFAALPDVQNALNDVQTQNERLHTQAVPEPNSQKEGHIQGRAARDARKSYNVHMARMRSEYIGASATGSFLWHSASLEQSRPGASRGSHTGYRSTSQLGTFNSNTDTGKMKRPLSSHGKRTLKTNKPKPQDVFQARFELEELAAEQKRKLSKRFKEMVIPSRPKHPFLAEFFRKRDIIFVVDNAGSMADSWPQATELLDVLVRKAKNLDDNGMDLYFTHTNSNSNAALSRQRNSTVVRAPIFSPKLDGEKDVAKFKEAMKLADSRPLADPKTDLSLILGFLLDRYIMLLRDFGTNNAKKQTIIVLTDGNWELDKVSEVIKEFVNTWKGLDCDKIQSRSMGIQFVQFGNDPYASLRLEYLDNKLPFEGVPDIVDTEPSLGDVYKMLIGSFIADYDERSSVSPSSPPAPQIMFSDHDIQSSPPSLHDTKHLQQISTTASARLQLPPTLERLPTSMDPGPAG